MFLDLFRRDTTIPILYLSVRNSLQDASIRVIQPLPLIGTCPPLLYSRIEQSARARVQKRHVHKPLKLISGFLFILASE